MTSDQPNYIRLRQICLAHHSLVDAEEGFRSILGLDVSYRDDRVAKHGLENFVMPIGTGFLEVVAPFREPTAVGRFLARRQGGYMAIFDCSDVNLWKMQIDALGVRIAHHPRYQSSEHMQLHPKDTGATIIEINRSENGAGLYDRYDPGGENWKEHVRTDIAVDLVGADFLTPRPDQLCALWSKILMRNRVTGRDVPEIVLDKGRLRFREDATGVERLDAIQITVRNVNDVLMRARAFGCKARPSGFFFCGVWFELNRVR